MFVIHVGDVIHVGVLTVLSILVQLGNSSEKPIVTACFPPSRGFSA